MNCPYCHQEMQKGYVSQNDFRFPLEWYPASQDTKFFKSKKQNIKLTAALKGGNVIVHYCPECKKFVIDQDELET